jgi:hypothetical protein
VEAEQLVLGPAAEVEDEGHDQQADDGQDLDGGEDELRLAVYPDREDVEADDEDDDDCDPEGDEVVVFAPVRYHQAGGRYLGAQRDGARVPVVPADGEAERRVDVARAVLRDGAGQRHPRRHLAEALHHGEDGEPREAVAHEHGERACLCEGGADTQEEAGADGAAQRDELDVAGLEP